MQQREGTSKFLQIFFQFSSANVKFDPQVIPRTRAFDPKLHYLSEDEFLQQLIPKLELLRKEQESKELLKSKGFEVRCLVRNFSDVRTRLKLSDSPAQADAQKSNKIFADAINAKFILIDDKDDQEILDEHVSRVWSDMTPHRSPGNASPCNQFQRKKPHEMVFVPGGSKFRKLLRITRD